MMLDVVWPGAFAPFLVDLKPALGSQAKLHAQGIIQNDTVDGKLVAMPWFGDFGILYYRTDLLKKYGYSAPPTTWTELGTMAKKIQAGEQPSNPNFYGFVWQGNAYEGLTCDALEWIASSGGGNIIDGRRCHHQQQEGRRDPRPDPQLGRHDRARGVTSYQEEDARNAFDNGNAAFMRNWPYAYSASKGTAVDGKFAVTVLPHENGAVRSERSAAGRSPSRSTRSTRRRDRVGSVPDEPDRPAVRRHLQLERADDPVGREGSGGRQDESVPDPRDRGGGTGDSARELPETHYAQGSQVIYQGVNQIENGDRHRRCCRGWRPS